METSKIEIVLRAIKLGSLTKAADEYGYSPSAVSQMVTALENEIGAQIITRSYNGISVSDGMEDIIRSFEDIIKSKNKIMKSANEKIKGKKAITIATYSSISKYILPTVIKKYKDLHNEIDINIIVSDDLDLIYKKGTADILFGERIKSSDTKWEHIIQDPYLAVLPKSNKCLDDSITREALLKRKFIIVNDRNIIDYMCECVSEDTINNNSSDDSSVIELVKAGMCVSVLSGLAVFGVNDISLKNLNPPLCRDLGFMYNENDVSGKRHIADFKQFLGEYIKQNFTKSQGSEDRY